MLQHLKNLICLPYYLGCYVYYQLTLSGVQRKVFNEKMNEYFNLQRNVGERFGVEHVNNEKEFIDKMFGEIQRRNLEALE